MPDAFRPEAPLPPHFDDVRQAWIFSRYADVYAALREPALLQSSPGHEVFSGDPAERHAAMFAAVQHDLARMSSPAWRLQMESTLQSLLTQHRGKSVDLVRDILHPWSTSLLLQLTGIEGLQGEQISRLSTRMFYANAAATADPSRAFTTRLLRKFTQIRKKRDSAAVQRLSQAGIFNISTFAGLSQTLPSFLAKAWLALLESPQQVGQLATHPEAIAGATEELLRYAGIVHTLYRKAEKQLCIGEVTILNDQRVLLRLASANFDPERFDQPNLLDLNRKTLGNLGLGTGMHACVGAVLVRQACNIATPIFFAANPALEPNKNVRWTIDSSLSWPSSISIQLNSLL